MISMLLSFLGSSVMGSAVGGILALFNRKADLESKKADLLHEQAKWGHEMQLRAADLEIAKAEAQGRREVAMIESDGQIESARMATLAESHKAETLDPQLLSAAGWFSWLFVLVEALRRSIRPVSTIALLVAAFVANFTVMRMVVDAGVDKETAMKLWEPAIAWILGQASACLAYWYMSRSNGK